MPSQDGLVGDITDVDGGATCVTDLARSWVIDIYISDVLLTWPTLVSNPRLLVVGVF